MAESAIILFYKIFNITQKRHPEDAVANLSFFIILFMPPPNFYFHDNHKNNPNERKCATETYTKRARGASVLCSCGCHQENEADNHYDHGYYKLLF